MMDAPVTVTTFPDHAAWEKAEDAPTLAALRDRVLATHAPTKAALPWLKLAGFGGHRSAKGSLRHGANVLVLSGVEGDYDGETHPPAWAVERLEAAGIRALVYTSPSHTPDRPRWRVLCPTVDWLPPTRHAELVARVNGLLGGTLARESFTLAQAYYFGHLDGSNDHGAWLIEGTRCVDEADDLAAGAVYPAPSAPVNLPPIPQGLPPDAHAATALRVAAESFTGAGTPDRPRHDVLRAATLLVAPMVKSGHLDADTVAAVLSDAMESSGRAPNDGEVESLLSGALRIATPYEPPTHGAEFASVAITPPTRATLRLIHPADCETGPRRGYVVKGLIAPGDVAAIVGAPGCGKSMLAPLIGYVVAQGQAVMGMRTKPGRVLYVAAEDATGMRQRVHALKLRYGDAPDFALCETGNLREPGAVTLLWDTVAEYAPALVFIDTLGAAWAGLDENASGEMGAVVALARQIAATGAAVVLVHHTAKHGDGTPRGHSVLNGTLDMALRLEAAADDGVIRGVVTKNRNGTTDQDITFRVDVATLGQDDDGDAITAPVAVPLASGEGKRPDRLPRTEAAALTMLRDLAAKASGAPVDEAIWRQACDDRRISTSDNPKNRADVMRRAFAGLRDRGLVRAGGGVVWVPTPGDEFAAIVATGGDSRATIAHAEAVG